MDALLENIVRRRKKLHFSQKDMAEKLGTYQSNYSRMETGETELTVKKLYQIASLLEISVKALFEYTISKEEAHDELIKKWSVDIYNLKNEIENLNKELKGARRTYRGYYLLTKILCEVFKEFEGQKDSDITLAELNRVWNDKTREDLKNDYKSYNEYVLNFPPEFGFPNPTIMEAINIARVLSSNHVENFLNKNPEKYGASDYLTGNT